MALGPLLLAAAGEAETAEKLSGKLQELATTRQTCCWCNQRQQERRMVKFDELG